MHDSSSRWRETGADSDVLLRAIFDAADVVAGVFELLDDDYRYVVANRNAAAFYGREAGGLDGLTGRDLGLTDEQIRVRLEVLRKCRRTGEAHTEEYRFSLPERSGWFFGTFSPVAGEAPYVAFVVIDVTRRRQAQREAEQQKARLALALDATELGLWEYDLATGVVDWDARTRKLFGGPAEGPIDYATYASLVHPEDLPVIEAAYGAALTGTNDGHYQVEHRTAAAGARGSAAWIRGAARVVFGRDGAPRRIIGTAQDISAQVAARESQELLLAELNHRVKNNLAAVQAIASHTLRHTHDPTAFRRAFEDRIQSLARGHDLLTRNAWRNAELGEVLAAALAPFETAAVSLLGGVDPVHVEPGLAVNLVMLLNELATNAAKYGALSTEAGRIAIDWQVRDGALRLTWRETGGPPVQVPSHAGFGSRLIRSALTPFGGAASVAFEPDGLSCEVNVPLGVEQNCIKDTV